MSVAPELISSPAPALPLLARPSGLSAKLLAALSHRYVLGGVWIALTVVALVPLWSQRVLTLYEAPLDFAMARGWASYAAPLYRISQHYDLNVRFAPGVLFLAFMRGAMALHVPLEVAHKLFLSLYVVLFPLSVLSLGRAFGRSPWLMLGSFALLFNQNWIFGSAGFLFGSCLVLIGVGRALRYLEARQDRHLAAVALLGLAVYASDLVAWSVFVALVLALLWAARSRVRAGVWLLAALFPGAILAASEVLLELSDPLVAKTDIKWVAHWHDFPTLAMELPRRIADVVPGHLDTALLVVLALTIFAALLWRGESGGASRAGELKAMVAALGALYLLLPFSIERPLTFTALSPRLPWLMMTLVLLSPPGRIRGMRVLLLLPLLAMELVFPIKLSKRYRVFSWRVRPFLRLVESLPMAAPTLVVRRGLAQANIDASEDSASSGAVYGHFTAWPLALRGGVDPFVSPLALPIRPKAESALYDMPVYMSDFLQPWQAPKFRYYLVHDAVAFWEKDPALHKIDEGGDWTLFERVRSSTDEP